VRNCTCLLRESHRRRRYVSVSILLPSTLSFSGILFRYLALFFLSLLFSCQKRRRGSLELQQRFLWEAFLQRQNCWTITLFFWYLQYKKAKKKEEDIQIGVRISMTTVHPYSPKMHIHVMDMNMIKTLTDLTSWLNRRLIFAMINNSLRCLSLKVHKRCVILLQLIFN
jgi:hypothetical protein